MFFSSSPIDRVQSEIAKVEKQIFELEANYLSAGGNVVTGFGDLLGRGGSGGTGADATAAGSGFKEEDRIFSKSSVTSPFYKA